MANVQSDGTWPELLNAYKGIYAYNVNTEVRPTRLLIKGWIRLADRRQGATLLIGPWKFRSQGMVLDSEQKLIFPEGTASTPPAF